MYLYAFCRINRRLMSCHDFCKSNREDSCCAYDQAPLFSKAVVDKETGASNKVLLGSSKNFLT